MARRYKSYAAETGVSYQYFYAGCHRVVRPEMQGPGSDYGFVVTGDQGSPFTLRVFISDRAMAAWRQIHGRELDANELYAAAKMQLFRSFDEQEELRKHGLSLVVDETNIEELLEPLDLA